MSLRVNFRHVAAEGSLPHREGLDRRPPEPGWWMKIEKGIHGGVRNLTDPRFLLPMVAAQGVFGLSRLAILGLTPRGVSTGAALTTANLGAFASEGLAFVGSARGIDHVMGREAVPGTSFAKELGHTYLTLGLLRTFGGATHAALHRGYHQIPAPLLSLQDKIILKTAPQAAQFGGIYLSHTLAPGLGLGEYIDPGERAYQSAVALAHFGAAGHLLNQIPGYAHANQKIHREAQKLGDQLKDNLKNHMALPTRPLTVPGNGAVGLGNEMWMNSSDHNGGGKGGHRQGKPAPVADSQPSSGKRLTDPSSDGDRSESEITLRRIPEAESIPDPLLGQTIDGRYYVESVLGEGGMGKVYRGRHRGLNKQVAIKVLLQDLARRGDMLQRFINEAQAASMIGNPHIIDVSDFGRLPNGSTYFIMEYLKGQALGELTSLGKPLPLPQLLNISLQVTEGMAAAHDVNIVHRDLKPDNIFLSPRGSDKEFVKILDFGIAKIPVDSKLTIPGEVFGTPDYLSPEQATGQKVDHRSDIYSMGVILYEMATGRVPFVSENYQDVLHMHMMQEPPPPRSLVPDPMALPPGLEAIILKSLRKDPAERYQSMNELQADLVSIQQGLRPQALNSHTWINSHTRFNSHTWIKDWRLWAGLFGTALTGAATFALLRKDPEEGGSPMPLPPPPDKKGPVTAPPTPIMQPPEPPPTSYHRVQMTLLPADAHVFFEGADLGEGRVSLNILPGDKVVVEVRRRGYKTEKVFLDGSKLEVSVKLKPLRPSAPVIKPPPITKSSPTPKSPPPRPKGDDIVRPW